MPGRRVILTGGMALAGGAHAQSPLPPEWQGRYAGTLRFYRSIPLEDIYPPPPRPHVDEEDPAPIGCAFSIDAADGQPVVWLRIDAGPMQTAEGGETLRFAHLLLGAASLLSAQAVPEPHSASLTVRPDLIGTEALFPFADGSFWRRHFTARFTPAGADLIVWVFDANGTRARTWRGSASRL
jgi:hypothetical protein